MATQGGHRRLVAIGTGMAPTAGGKHMDLMLTR